MQLPKRPQQHIIESISYKIFSNIIPNEWIIRDITERDYGVDCYIEVCSDNLVTGQLLSVQLKGTESIDSDDGREYVTYYNIKPSTFNYWDSLPVPVVFVYIDIKKETFYYINIKSYIRKCYRAFIDEELSSVKIPVTSRLEKRNSRLILQMIYLLENDREYFDTTVTNFALSIASTFEVLVNHYGRDCFLPLDEDKYDEMRILMLYKETKYLASKFDVEWTVKSINEMIDDGQKMFGRTHLFYEKQISDFVKGVIPIINSIIFKLENKILKSESDYWEEKNNLLWEYLKSDNYARQKKEIIELGKDI